MATKAATSTVSESNTEGIFRNFYKKYTFLEKTAIPGTYGFKSKKRTTYKGYPDFFLDLKDFAIVVEAKAENKDFSKAVSEAKFYGSTNNLTKDVVVIGISGQTESTYSANIFTKLKGEKYELIDTCGKLASISEIERVYRERKYGPTKTPVELRATLHSLNNTLHNEVKIKDTERSLFFSGLMIALKDRNFRSIYKSIEAPDMNDKAKKGFNEAHNLNEAIIGAITNQITNKINNRSKEFNWKDRFTFIMNVNYPLVEYKQLIETIERNIFVPFENDESQDILGRAYKIFLSKAGKVDNKNIILTPDHIKTLMVDLARLSVDDVVIDTCTGSGGFLMESMERLLHLAASDEKKANKIKRNQLIGFETDPTLFALACSNMFLHGDGRTNLIFGSSILNSGNSEDKKTLQYIARKKPNKCIINPPYENNLPIRFTLEALKMLTSGGRLVIIMPTPTLNRNMDGLTKEVLSIGKLEFVIKMPNNLFSEQGRTVNTSIFCFTKTPHNPKDPVRFFNMEYDGLISVQHKGRVDKNNQWESIRKNVTDCLLYNKKVSAEYDDRLIADSDGYNCYGIKKNRRSTKSTKLVPIGQLFKEEKGSLASENCDNAGDYAFVTAGEGLKRHSSYSHNTEAIIYAISASGSLGRAHYYNGKFSASNLCLILTPKNQEKYPVNLSFYSIYFNKIRKQIVNEIADGTSKLTIGVEDLKKYKVNYYPIEKQNELVGIYRETVLKKREELDSAIGDFNEEFDKIL